MRLPGITSSIASVLATFVAAGACAEIRLPAVFSDNMVLQRDAQAPIWGWSGPGDEVTVVLGEQTVKCTADLDGCWRTVLDTRGLGDGPFQIEVRSKRPVLAQGGRYARTIRNVALGDVWLCAGGTYMNGRLSDAPNAQTEVPAARHPGIRLFHVQPAIEETPAEDVAAKWTPCAPGAAREFSALAYFFGEHLHRALETPIGLIQCSADGTPLAAWTATDALAGDPDFTRVLLRYEEAKQGFTERMEEHRRAMAKWSDEDAAAKREGRTPPPQPVRPFGPGHPQQPGGFYNGMIAPLASFGVKGVLWHQGEHDARGGSRLYRKLFPAMIRQWRREWEAGDFPFIYAQLPNHGLRRKTPGKSLWAQES